MEKNETQVLADDALKALFEGHKPQEEQIEENNETLEQLFAAPETKIETPQASTVEQPKTEAVNPQNTFYLNMVKEFIADGEWEDLTLELEDGQQAQISQFEEITPELFKQLRDTQKSYQKQKLESSYISIEGLDDKDKKLIELKKAGGDISQLIQIEAQHVHPLQGIDMEDERNQESLVRQKLQHSGLKPKYIEAEIAELKENLTLDIEAKKIVAEVNEMYEQKLAESLKQQEALNTQRQEEQKKLRKTLTETFRGFDIQKDAVIKNFVDAATKTDSENLTQVEKTFFELQEKDPQHFAEVVFLLTDKKGYDEFKATKAKNETNLKTVNQIFKIAPKQTGATIQTPASTNALEELFNKK